MPRETLSNQGNMSCEVGPGTWAIANVSKWVCRGPQTVYDQPGSLGDSGRYPPLDIPISTPEAPYTPVPRELALWLLEQNDPNFGQYDRGLRAWFIDWPGKAQGKPCERNDRVMEQIKHIAAGDEQPPDLLARIEERNRPWAPPERAEIAQAKVLIPDENTSIETLASIVKANKLQHLVTPKMPHATRIQIVRGALLDRFMRSKPVATREQTATAA